MVPGFIQASYGNMAEWSKAAVCKTVIREFESHCCL